MNVLHVNSRSEYALVEGVMGLFDGVKGTKQDSCPIPIPSTHSPIASTAHIARLLDLPVMLVLDCSRLSGSVARSLRLLLL